MANNIAIFFMIRVYNANIGLNINKLKQLLLAAYYTYKYIITMKRKIMSIVLLAALFGTLCTGCAARHHEAPPPPPASGTPPPPPAPPSR
jgi:hypothetical protein